MDLTALGPYAMTSSQIFSIQLSHLVNKYILFTAFFSEWEFSVGNLQMSGKHNKTGIKGLWFPNLFLTSLQLNHVIIIKKKECTGITVIRNQHQKSA